ncbi:putative transmembrane lipoprotein [Ralstonia solanacearum PSI07]|nr:putative transmembrane lipoprotein [Ralstonia solanacearum PSI07]
MTPDPDMTDRSTTSAVRSPRLRRWAGAAAAALALAAVLAACMPTGWTGDGYTFSRGQLQDALARKFPFQRRYLGVFDVTLVNPQLTLDAARNRIAIQADARVESGLFRQPLIGPLAVSSGLHYDAPTRSIRLDQPSVDRFDLQNVPGGLGPQISALGSLMAGQLLADYAVYTFKPEQLKVAGIAVEPGTITVLPEGVHVQAKRP